MTGNTADISHICEFGWYDWVMFRDNVPSFPDNKMTLGRYLGPATDVGSALTAKILKPSGNFTCRSTFCHFTDEETHCAIHARMRLEFDASMGDILGRPARDDDFPAEDLTPDHDHVDPSDYGAPDLEVKVTPEANDPFVGAEIRLPLGGILKNGRVASRKRDADGNPARLSHDNPILDTREYVVQFDDGDATKLTANMIAESMYSQCGPNGYEYYLFNCIVDHRRLDSAIALKD
jgi:hypothetical protein